MHVHGLTNRIPYVLSNSSKLTRQRLSACQPEFLPKRISHYAKSRVSDIIVSILILQSMREGKTLMAANAHREVGGEVMSLVALFWIKRIVLFIQKYSFKAAVS